MQTTEKLPPAASAEARKMAAEVKKIAARRSEGGKGDEVVVVVTTGGAGLEDEGMRVSSERAFADYVFGSLILHAFCVNFIN